MDLPGLGASSPAIIQSILLLYSLLSYRFASPKGSRRGEMVGGLVLCNAGAETLPWKGVTWEEESGVFEEVSP